MVVGELSEATEVAIIGGGMGGYVAAIRLAQLGKEATIISKDPLPGGECLFRGCIPSKALIEAGNLWQKMHHAKDIGIEVGESRLNVPVLQEWKRGITEKLGSGVAQLLKQHGIAYHQAAARFLDAHTIEAKGETGLARFQFKKAIIATGSFATPLPNLPFDGQRILSSEEALNLQEVPKKLIVIGGGYIGLELGQVFAKFGSEVTIVEAMDDLLPGIESELKRPLKKKLEAMGVRLLLKTRLKSCENTGNEVKVSLEDADGKSIADTASHVLVAIGRSPRSENLSLEKAGVKIDDKGFIPVDPERRSNIHHIYAVGDVAGGMMLAHKAAREGAVAAGHIAGQAEAFDNQVPAVIFTDPEIAYVGLTAKQAEAQGLETSSGLFSFAVLGRAMTLNENEGFVRVVAEKSSGRILGVQMTGPHVSDLISEATLAIEIGASAEDLSMIIHPHPTLSEAFQEAAEGVLGMAIHRYQKLKN